MMRTKTTISILAAVCLTACAGTDPAQNNGSENNTNPNGTPNGSMNNTSSNSTANNTNPNSTANNTNPNSTANNTNPNNTNPNNTNPNNTNPNNTNPTEWRALVGNGDFTEDTSSWSIVVYDGDTVSSTTPQQFGSGQVVVASSAGLGYVVDVETGQMLVLEPNGTEVDTIDLQVSEVDSATAGNGTLLAASGDMGRIAQYSGTGGGLGSQIPVSALAVSGDPLYIRNMATDGNLVAGVATESSMFPSTPQVFVADASSATLEQQIGVSGALKVDSMGNGNFAVATRYDGIQILRQDGSTWVVDQTLMADSAFGNAEVEGVIMAGATKGVALTYNVGPGFVAYSFDSDAGTATELQGFALPTALIGGDVSADGEYFFIGDYGIRNQNDTPWGVGVVDANGQLLGHVMTDDSLPPMSIAAMN